MAKSTSTEWPSFDVTGGRRLFTCGCARSRSTTWRTVAANAGSAAVVRRLMAKHPDDRYQTPGELAAALETLLRTGDLPGIERVAQRRLVDQAAARAIDDAHAAPSEPERARVDDVAGAVGQRRVQGDEIRAAEQFIEIELVDTEIDRALGDKYGS